MTQIKTISIKEEHELFLKKHNISLSKLVQKAISKEMQKREYQR